ncbi:MAG: FAD-dependent oxidoreductase [Candidatus Competibacteraceae bacterium]|nr:FAD-dependent oxidoreductase [Candidatus Competibacteraceae bacterium]
MNLTNSILRVDVAIIGGGIAGLWMLSRLRKRGYSALLIESEALGAGQTICSQGIIHGGVKYSLNGRSTEAAQMISEMPALWRRCLNGEGEIDLRGSLLVEHQYLLATRSPRSWLTGFIASKMLPDRLQKLAGVEANDYPPALRQAAFEGTVYRLDEPIVDVASVLASFAERHREAIVLCDGPAAPSGDGAITLRYPNHPMLAIRPSCTIFAAGAGNSAVPWAPLQQRPLHMVLVRGLGLPGPMYGHFVNSSDVPRLTITTHCDANGHLLWYLGGELAESGVKRDRQEQIRVARRELAALLPSVDWSKTQFATFTVKRAESRQDGGSRPVGPSVSRDGRTLAVWPTKLALAPLLAEQVENTLRMLDLKPKPVDLRILDEWPRPTVATYPWDREDLIWS